MQNEGALVPSSVPSGLSLTEGTLVEPIKTDREISQSLFGEYHGALNELEDMITKGYHNGNTMSDDVKIYLSFTVAPINHTQRSFRDVVFAFHADGLIVRRSLRSVSAHVEKRKVKSKRFNTRFTDLNNKLKETTQAYQKLNPLH